MPKRYKIKLIILITILTTAGCSMVQTNIDKGDYIIGVYSSYLDNEGEVVVPSRILCN